VASGVGNIDNGRASGKVNKTIGDPEMTVINRMTDDTGKRNEKMLLPGPAVVRSFTRFHSVCKGESVKGKR
jgi:hypothetical protein